MDSDASKIPTDCVLFFQHLDILVVGVSFLSLLQIFPFCACRLGTICLFSSFVREEPSCVLSLKSFISQIKAARDRDRVYATWIYQRQCRQRSSFCKPDSRGNGKWEEIMIFEWCVEVKHCCRLQLNIFSLVKETSYLDFSVCKSWKTFSSKLWQYITREATNLVLRIDSM